MASDFTLVGYWSCKRTESHISAHRFIGRFLYKYSRIFKNFVTESTEKGPPLLVEILLLNKIVTSQKPKNLAGYWSCASCSGINTLSFFVFFFRIYAPFKFVGVGRGHNCFSNSSRMLVFIGKHNKNEEALTGKFFR